MSDCAQITSVLAATSLASSSSPCSSLVVSPNRGSGAYSRSSSTSSAGTTATSPSSSPRHHHYRGGSSSSSTTDRFIPSRVSSNLNFTLKTGTGRKNPIVRSIGTNGGGGERRGGGSDGGSSGGAGGGGRGDGCGGGGGDSNDVFHRQNHLVQPWLGHLLWWKRQQQVVPMQMSIPHFRLMMVPIKIRRNVRITWSSTTLV